MTLSYHCNSNINFLVFFLLTGFAASSSSSYISNGVFEPAGTGRALLQTKKKCTEDFENKNYTVITSQCKGPQYPTDKCCEGFKQFACPIRDSINDLKSDCAATMFSYINLYGKFPPGLFAHKCREGKEGLECKDENTAPTSSAPHVVATSCSTLLLMFTTGCLVLLLLPMF